MSKSTLKFQETHSRNLFDWQAEKVDGRLVFSAEGKGVHYRMGKIVNILAKYPNINRAAILRQLHKVNKSYTNNDLEQPLDQMLKAEVITRTFIGKGRKKFVKYKLTPNGRATITLVSKGITT